MKLLIIGATGPTGRQLVSQALELGHAVTVTVRQPTPGMFPAKVKTIVADVRRADSLQAAVGGQEVVISSLGSKLSRKPTTLFSEGTQNLIAAMEASHVRRLICITGIGAGDSKGHGGFLYDRIIQPLLLAEIYNDKTRQEAVIRASRTDWTIVRPAALTNGARTGRVRAYTDLSGVTVGKISRADVAGYILERISDPTSFRQTFTIAS